MGKAERVAERGWDEIDKDPKRALALFDEALSRGHENVVYCYLGRALADRELLRFADGIAELEKAIQEDPELPNLYSLRGNLRMNIASKEADNAIARPLLEQAIEDYDRALVLDPHDEARQSDRADIVSMLAERAPTPKADNVDVNRPSQPKASGHGEFESTLVTRYDGAGHRMLNCQCTLADDRLLIVDGKGRMYQMLYRDITGVDPQPQGMMSSGVNIVGVTETWHIAWKGKSERRELASRISRAIAASVR